MRSGGPLKRLLVASCLAPARSAVAGATPMLFSGSFLVFWGMGFGRSGVAGGALAVLGLVQSAASGGLLSRTCGRRPCRCEALAPFESPGGVLAFLGEPRDALCPKLKEY